MKKIIAVALFTALTSPAQADGIFSRFVGKTIGAGVAELLKRAHSSDYLDVINKANALAAKTVYRPDIAEKLTSKLSREQSIAPIAAYTLAAVICDPVYYEAAALFIGVENQNRGALSYEEKQKAAEIAYGFSIEIVDKPIK